MPERSDLDRRLRAVERALTDGDHDVAGLEDAAAVVDRLDDLESRIAALEERVDELDAATQAVRGYVGNVRAVNDDVADRADAALAAVERIEARLDGTGVGSPGTNDDAPSRDGDGPATPGNATAAHERRGPDSIAGDGRGIQMPAAGANGTATGTGSRAGPAANGDRPGDRGGNSGERDGRPTAARREGGSSEDGDRSVIDRVREVL